MSDIIQYILILKMRIAKNMKNFDQINKTKISF